MEIVERFSVRPFAIIGHRGAKGRKPENTLAAFKYGIESGADIVECDVRKTRDGKLIILHDDNFKRLAGIDISPREVDFSYIRENIRIEGEPVALLEEVIDVTKGKVGLAIEIKEPDTIDEVIRLVEEKEAVERVAIISFYEDALKRAKDLNKKLITGIIYLRPPGKIIEAKKMHAEVVLPMYRLATEKAVAFAHRLKLKVAVWTVNDEETAKEMFERKVDAMASDYPDLLVNFRQSLT